ncbi:hypothetical protein ACFO0N_05600 [Halobium salinum]|uniref:Uncharacterized protein n=1 Tax=Halobium salinum TaxID=1364940 RepID=A0ABD5PAF5_9EURY|nr:hypothetical protein [Halobium salinum]
MSINSPTRTTPSFTCPFCRRQESVHNRPLHLRTCSEVDHDVQIERVQRNTIDAEYDRAFGECR